MISSFRTASGVRWWATGVGLAGAALAAAMIGSVAHAETPDDVMDQAIQDLMQGTSVLDAAPTALNKRSFWHTKRRQQRHLTRSSLR